MLITMIGLTYLGTAGCYVASPSTGSTPVANGAARWMRAGGLLLLGLGLGAAVGTHPVGEGILVWEAMAMTAASLLVVAAPLLDRFVTVTVPLAFGLVVLGVIV